MAALAGVRTTPVKRFPTRSLGCLAVYVKYLWFLMVVACRTGAIFMRFTLACKTPKNNACSVRQVRSDCEGNDLWKRNTKKIWLAGKQKLVRDQSDFLARLMREVKTSRGSSAEHCDTRSGAQECNPCCLVQNMPGISWEQQWLAAYSWQTRVNTLHPFDRRLSDLHRRNLWNFCYGINQSLLKPFSTVTDEEPWTSKSDISVTHKQQQTFHDISQALFAQCTLYSWNQSQSRLEHKTLGRSLGANQLSCPNAGRNLFKQTSHWLGAIEETALCSRGLSRGSQLRHWSKPETAQDKPLACRVVFGS